MVGQPTGTGVFMRATIIAAAVLLVSFGAAHAQYMGNMSANPYLPPAAPQLPGTFTNPYGSGFNSPKLYDSQGNFHGNVNSNPYDPDSIANPYGRYGSQYSPDSINNPYGQYGSRYSPQSPNNPYGTGMPVYGTTP
jgi:hypothetical protein